MREALTTQLMKLDDLEESDNVEDRRSEGGGGGGGFSFGGGGGGIPLGGKGLALVAVVAVVMLIMGKDPRALLNIVAGGGGSPAPMHAPAAPDDPAMVTFVKKVLGSTETVWTAEFQKMGKTYPKPHLDMFTQRIRSGCGLADAGMGPFYCPEDQKVYIDLSFYKELKDRFGAPGQFAQAYVIAHEVGHHVQHVLGLSRPLDEARARGASEKEINALSVRLELQADFLAGMWAKKQDERNHFLDPGDIEEAMRCAKAIGDDTLQRQAQGRVVPDSFTHGSSAQRMKWFMKGYQTGDINQGDTFHATDL